jgi:hypothetical protein
VSNHILHILRLTFVRQRSAGAEVNQSFWGRFRAIVKVLSHGGWLLELSRTQVAVKGTKSWYRIQGAYLPHHFLDVAKGRLSGVTGTQHSLPID